MGKIVLVGDKYTVSLFEIMGAEGIILEDPYQLENSLISLKKREDVDLVLVTKDIYDPVREKVDPVISGQTKPLITVIPSPYSESAPMDVRKMVLRALGFG
ncbi:MULTISPECIES: V-type ATP synthase subunit F [Acidianus]|uniref:ATP synthase subunit F n=1 Tax=Candidatus Acidianus copahuensis TaxID=1160895 RepID=A0A031LPR6_9CREN|nr:MULTISPECIES: V-type ATP synthase subunit F [Acidianus]EZQ06996.1 ATP synthase subunit F [Candidatus Acidianus copahuensis]NON61869.1 V-type ATP synthase subunit F [Acidianus sp. RZ1]